MYTEGRESSNEQDVLVKQYASTNLNKVQKIISIQVLVKVTGSLTLMSFERASLVEYENEIRTLFKRCVKGYLKLKVDNMPTRQNNIHQIILPSRGQRATINILKYIVLESIKLTFEFNENLKLTNILDLYSITICTGEII